MQAADERAKSEMARFKGQKPLFEKLAENYEQLEKQQVGSGAMEWSSLCEIAFGPPALSSPSYY